MLLAFNPVLFTIILEYLIKMRQSTFYTIAKKAIIKVEKEHCKKHNITPSYVLRLKDDIKLSDRKYFLFTYSLHLTGGLIPCKTRIVEHRGKINAKCIKEFELESKTEKRLIKFKKNSEERC